MIKNVAVITKIFGVPGDFSDAVGSAETVVDLSEGNYLKVLEGNVDSLLNLILKMKFMIIIPDEHLQYPMLPHSTKNAEVS